MDKDLELMRRKLEQRVKKLRVLFGCVCTLIACTVAIRSHFVGAGEKYADLVAGCIMGILIGLDLIMMIYFNKYSEALKDNNKLEKLYW